MDSNGAGTLSAPVAVTTRNAPGRTANSHGGCASGGASFSALLGLLFCCGQAARARGQRVT